MTRADIAYTDMTEPYTNQVANIRVTHGGSNVHVLMQPESTSITTVAVPGSIPDDDLPVRITAVINDITVVFTRAVVSGTIRYTLTDDTFVDAKRVLYTTSPATVPHQGTLSSIEVQDDADATNPLRFEVATIGTGVIPALEGVDTQLYYQRLFRDNDFIAAIWEYRNGGWTKAINFENNSITTEDPNEVTIGAQPYASDPDASDTDVVGFLFLGDQHEVTNLNDIAWIHHGNNYFIKQGLDYFSLRRIQEVHPILEGKQFAISAIYEPLNQRARVLIMVEDIAADRTELETLFLRTTPLFMPNTDITLRWFNTNFDFDMNLGSGDVVNCAVFEYVDRDADGNQTHVNSYEEFLELYQFDKPTKFFLGGTLDNPIGIAPAANLEFIPFPGAQVLRKEDDRSYTEYIYEGERYIDAGNSAAPRHSESDTGPVVTKIIRTSGAGSSPGFAGFFRNEPVNKWMLFPSVVMLQTSPDFVIRESENTAPTGFTTNWRIVRRLGTSVIDMYSVLILRRRDDDLTTVETIDLLISRQTVEDRDATTQITGLRVTVGGVNYDLPISSTSFNPDPDGGVADFTMTFRIGGPSQDANQIHFDISSLPTLSFSGSSANLDFEILVSGVPVNGVEAEFIKATDPDEHVRVQREATRGSTHFDRLTQQAYIQCGDVWRHLQIETATVTVNNRDTHQDYDINPNVRKYVFDMRQSTGSITARFDAADHTPGTTWVIERVGETYLTELDATGRVDQETSQIASNDLDQIDNAFRNRAIHARSHGFIHGTPITVHFDGTHDTFGLSDGGTYWVRDVWDEAFTLVDNYEDVRTGDVASLVDLGVWPTSGNPAVRNVITFRPIRPELEISIPFRPSRFLRHDRQRLVVEYPNHDIRLESNFIHPIGWHSFSKIESTGSGNPFASLGDVRGAWTIDNSHIHFEVVGRITNTGNLDIESLRSHSIIMPFGLTVHNPFRRMFLENPSTSGADRDLEMLVGRVNYQQGGGDGQGDNWAGLLRLQKDEFNRLRPHSFQSLSDPQDDPEDEDVAVGDMIWWSWKIPTSDIS